MKNYRFRINNIGFACAYRFGSIVRVLSFGFLCVCTGSFLTSCAPTLPKETYLKGMSLSGISKVAIVVSVNAPEVSYATYDNVSLKLFLIYGLIPAIAEGAVRSGVDHGHAGEVKKHSDLTYFKETIARSFMQTLKKGDYFQTTEYLTDKNQDVQQLSAKGYDAVIRLLVRQISLQRMKRVAGDNVGLDVFVRGQMEFLSSGKIVWDREEHVLSSEFHSLDYYEKNGLKELDAILEKAGRNLAYDFVYLK